MIFQFRLLPSSLKIGSPTRLILTPEFLRLCPVIDKAHHSIMLCVHSSKKIHILHCHTCRYSDPCHIYRGRMGHFQANDIHSAVGNVLLSLYL